MASNEALQQPILKAVGRRATQREELTALQELAAFVHKMPPEHSPEPKPIVSRFERLLVALAQAEVDYAVVAGWPSS